MSLALLILKICTFFNMFMWWHAKHTEVLLPWGKSKLASWRKQEAVNDDPSECTHPRVSFWPFQRNLLKTLQSEAITPIIRKITLQFFWTFSIEVIRPTKINILRRHFRKKKLFLKMKLSKKSFYKSWAPKLIFSNENVFYLLT